MADDSGSDDRTEAASEHRLQQAYDEGQLPLSREVVATAALVGGVLALMAVGPSLRTALLRVVVHATRELATVQPSSLLSLALRPLMLILVVVACAAVAALAAGAAQTRLRIWPQLALPNLERVWNGGHLRQAFSRQGLGQLGLSIVRAAVVGFVVYGALHDELIALPRLMRSGAEVQMSALLGPLSRSAGKLLAAMALLAAADLGMQHLLFRRRMRMTRDELRREMKEEEGDPLIRSRRRRRHRELLKGRAAVEVPRADVVVVNPTHVAVALRYRPAEDRAPRLTAKGKGVLADNMRELARANGIPIVVDIPLARLLYRRTKVGRFVPAETYRAVAAVLAFVYKLTGRDPRRRS